MPKNDYQLGDVNVSAVPQRGQGGRNLKAAEKPKDFRSAVRRLAAYCRRWRGWFLLAFALALGSTVLTLLGPGRLGRITDAISAGMSSGTFDLPAIRATGITLGLFYAASALMIYGQNYTLAVITHKIMYDMRRRIQEKLDRLPLARYDETSFGDVLSRMTNDVDTIGTSLNNALSQVVTALFTFAGGAVVMLTANLKLAAVALAASAAGFVTMRFMISHSQKYFSLRQRYLGELNGHIEEVYAAHQIVKAFNGEADAQQEFDRLNGLLYENNWRAQFLSGITHPLMEFIANFAYIAVCVTGALMARSGEISFGVIVAFITYVKLFTQQLSQLAQSTVDLQSAAAAGERVFAFLDSAEMADESAKTARLDKTAVQGRVVFDHVRFGYRPDQVIIRDFSLAVSPGMKVAIVGPTGAGKTTLVNLLMRFYEVDRGSIAVDGIPLQELTRENTHELFSMVLQDTWLFHGTIRDNVVFAKPDISDEQVREALRQVGLDHYIATLPQGIDTVLTDDSSISAGQRQLLTIARALVNGAPLLILDEATSSVDTRTEQVVQQVMDRMTAGHTSFTIAHRLSTIRNADLILVLKDGDIVETGTHEQLLARGGFYAQLWQSQFVRAESI